MFHRKVIHIRAEDSPNVKLGLAQKASGKQPTNDVLLEGVLTYEEYLHRRSTWDPVRQCVGLDGQFYKGKEAYLFPSAWLERSKQVASRLPAKRKGVAIGVDPAEGGDNSSWAVVDESGLVYMESIKTPDTTAVPNRTIALMNEYNVAAENVMFDRGGGGYEHVCQLRAMGYRVGEVSFGEAAYIEPLELEPLESREHDRGKRYAYKNRRAQMYWMTRQRVDPGVLNQSNGEYTGGWGIPAEYTELLRQMSLIPYGYDGEGRIVLPTKRRTSDNDSKTTLIDIIGHSPDECDALVLAVYAMSPRDQLVGQFVAGALW